MHGILLMDKPEGMTSNDLVRLLKRRVKPYKVGHSGTLDSAASGLMVLMLGAATRALEYLNETPKRYLMEVRLGEETDTCDKEGTVIRASDASAVSLEQVREVMARYIGPILQIPPHYSAIKRDGVPLYRLARKGIFPEIPPREVHIFGLELLKYEPPLLVLDLSCSKGTYARSIARDMGDELGVGGRLESLRRISSGAFHIDDAATVDEVKDQGLELISRKMVSLNAALAHMPEIKALSTEVRRLMRGCEIIVPKGRVPATDKPADGASAGFCRIASPDSRILIIVRVAQGHGGVSLRPVKVFNMLEHSQ